MNTQHTFMLQKIKKMSLLGLLTTLIGSNYPGLELIFMVPKMFEPLKFDCICRNLNFVRVPCKFTTFKICMFMGFQCKCIDHICHKLSTYQKSKKSL